jgi:hypothetical protein
MKKRGILLLIATAFMACDDMTTIYQEYLDRGETIYIGKVDSLQLFPGDGRVKLAWEINADPRLEDCIVYWDERADSLVVPIVRDAGGGRQKMSVVVEGLAERGHIFEVRTRDVYGNISLKTEKSAPCYGEKYRGGLSNRAIVAQEANPGVALVTWGTTENSVGVEFSYVNRAGTPRTVLVPPEETISAFVDYVSGGEFSYTTLYLPVATSIDTFRVDPVVSRFARAEVELSNKSEWEFIEESSHGDYGSFGSGERAFDGDNGTAWHSGWNGDVLPQWITIGLRGLYPVSSVEVVRPGDSWREDTEVIELWGCADEALDPLDPASFQKFGTITFAGAEESRAVKFTTPVPVYYLKLVGTRAKEDKTAVQVAEVNIKIVQ